MKAIIVTNNRARIEGVLSSIDGDRISIDAIKLTAESIRALSDARCTVSQLPSGKWYIIARFDRIKSYELLDESNE